MKLNGFIGGAYTLRSKSLDAQRCVNLYPSLDEVGTGKDGDYGMLLGCPGHRLLIDLADGGTIRGVYTSSSGGLFCVSGNKLYSISTSWTKTLIGTISTSGGAVCFADNGVQLILVDGTYGYIYTFSSGVFAQITDPDMPQATHVKFCDGYFILNQKNTGRFYITSLYDGFTIDSLDFATAEGSPDNLVAIEVLRLQVWLFGTESVQVYYDSGDIDFPFSPINGVFIETGAAAGYSVTKLDQTLFWLGKNKDGDGVVYMANGYQPLRISTNAIEYDINQVGDLSSVTAYGYQEEGATFYVINFSNRTWVYDLNSKLWHERAYFSNGNFSRQIAENHAFFNSTHVVGDYSSSKLYAADLNYYSDNGNTRKWLRSSPHVANGLNYVYYTQFQVDMEFGDGLNTGQGSDPILVMRQSNDGANSWSNERYGSMGKIGEFTRRCTFNRCGRARDRVFEVSGTDPTKVALLGAYIKYSVGER